jgi:AhpC/TSA family
MYPHERSLVENMQGKPFALLGVNTDTNREELKQTLVKEKITWRSWFDGGTEGPIDRQYGVQGWPTIYVIDHKGVIRYRNIGGAELDRAVETLLKEMEGEK